MEQRISQWMPLRDDKLGLNVQVIPWNKRADAHLWPEALNPTAYVVKDLFSTHDGNWRYQGDARWTPPAWALEYVKNPAYGQPGYFDDAGGDHNLFAAVLGLDGQLKTGWTMVFGKQGVTLAALTSQTAWETHPTKASGWANVPYWELYYPDQGQVGPWAVWPFGASDIVVGGGLPYNNHVSMFAVYQEIARPTAETPAPDEPPGVGSLAGLTAQVKRVADALERLTVHLGA